MGNMKNWKSVSQYRWGSIITKGTVTGEDIEERANMICKQEEATMGYWKLTGEIKARRGNNGILVM
jgi:hypothetical protein